MTHCHVEWIADDQRTAVSHDMSAADAEAMARTLTWAGCPGVAVVSADDLITARIPGPTHHGRPAQSTAG